MKNQKYTFFALNAGTGLVSGADHETKLTKLSNKSNITKSSNEMLKGVNQIKISVNHVNEMSMENNSNFESIKQETGKFNVSAGNERQKILIVDDDSIHLEMVEAVLSNKYDVSTAKSGKEALGLFYQSFIHNSIMPDMDSWNTYGRIKAISGLHDTPIAFFTVSSVIHYKNFLLLLTSNRRVVDLSYKRMIDIMEVLSCSKQRKQQQVFYALYCFVSRQAAAIPHPKVVSPYPKVVSLWKIWQTQTRRTPSSKLIKACGRNQNFIIWFCQAMTEPKAISAKPPFLPKKTAR
jgi:hypothetical protein